MKRFEGPIDAALELGCGNGDALARGVEAGWFLHGTGVDLDEARFRARRDSRLNFIATDLNTVQLEKNRYDLIYALQSFHHFEDLEHIMEQVSAALKPNGLFVLDEYVGPKRFQWTDEQLAFTSYLLGLMPRPLRLYFNGMEKRAEGRSTVDEVVAVCPSEAIRSNEIPQIFKAHFHLLYEKSLGGTIQHLLYSGIVQNFPDEKPDIDHLIDSVDAMETALITRDILPSDFVLLIGEKR
jgi:SAM-dependent methyltransferase